MSHVEMSGRGRLAFLADALERDAANPKGMVFDLNHWLDTYPDVKEPALECGTFGCAIGLAMLLPEFQEQGLEMVKNAFELFVPKYKDLKDFDAVGKFFRIPFDSASYLFNACAYDKRVGAEAELSVAARIREFLNDVPYRGW